MCIKWDKVYMAGLLSYLNVRGTVTSDQDEKKGGDLVPEKGKA